MNDKQIESLKKLCRKSQVMWCPDSSTARTIVSINKRKDELDEYCAIFANGEYVALYNCPVTDFIIAKRLE